MPHVERSWILGATASLIVAAVARWIYLDGSFGYVPITDSAAYLEAALHLAAGQGLRTLVGYPIGASAAPLLPAYFHPAGSLIPYAIAGLAQGSDRIAVALGVSLAMFLATVLVCFAIAAKITRRPLIAACVASAYGLDTNILTDASGILTTVPYGLVFAGVIAALAGSWPPSRKRIVLAGIGLAVAHFVRMNDVPVVASLAAVLAWDRQWRLLLGLVLPYAAGLLLVAPFTLSSPAYGAILIAGTPGFGGSSPAQMDPPSIWDALSQYGLPIARKTAANFAATLRLLPRSGDPYVMISGLAVALAGTLRGDRRLTLMVVAGLSSAIFTAAIALSVSYLVHLVLAAYLVVAAVIATQPSRARGWLAVALLTVAIGLYATDMRTLYRLRPQYEDRAGSLLRAALLIQAATTANDTVISDTAPVVGLYAERRSFQIPLEVAQLPELRRRIGDARILMLTRRGISDTVGYPDDAWRSAFDAVTVDGYTLVATLGSGAAEVHLYRR